MRNYLQKFSIYTFIKLEFISLLIVAIIILENFIYFKRNMDELFYSGSGYIQHLSKFNNNEDILTRLLEFSLSIYNYEKSNSNNFSVEIWDCKNCTLSSSPIWSISDIEINEDRVKVIKRKLTKKEFFILYNKYLYFANIYETRNKEYKVIYYKKIIYIFNLPFFIAIIILNLFCFMIWTFLVALPLKIYYNKGQDKLIDKIRVNTIHNTINLIKHSLDNQINVLNSNGNKEDIVKRAIHYNYQVAELIDDSRFTSINPKEFIEGISKFSTLDVKIEISINTYNLINYINKYLEHSIIVLIDNALHESVNAKVIKINISQKRYNSKIIIDVSNDGIPIELKIKDKIFDGYSTKENGHGQGLTNLKKMLNRSSAEILLYSNNPTTFRLLLPCLKYSNLRIKMETQKSRVNKKDDYLTIPNIEDIPLVIMIEDEILFWDEWKKKMTDAKVLFFKNPESFFSYSMGKRINNEDFLSKISLIICDFNFGDYNLIESGFFEDIDIYIKDKFNGNIVICSSYEKEALRTIPQKFLQKVKAFIPKKANNYQNILTDIFTNKQF
ncbi:ATP-binding protein [Fluviispira vulneris]|uniref:ATP-binding protein n=1 Tax=Fluviispira vulneris TaxID=2763012 RepID=UPI001645FC0C|nr:ATP-binding protein [Fluviispira vulneris]